MPVCVSPGYHAHTVRAMIILSSGSVNSSFQHYEGYPVGMKLPGEYKLEFSVFYD